MAEPSASEVYEVRIERYGDGAGPPGAPRVGDILAALVIEPDSDVTTALEAALDQGGAVEFGVPVD